MFSPFKFYRDAAAHNDATTIHTNGAAPASCDQGVDHVPATRHGS